MSLPLVSLRAVNGLLRVRESSRDGIGDTVFRAINIRLTNRGAGAGLGRPPPEFR